MDFIHLHLHTQYSLLDGANKVPDIIELARKLGHGSLAMTDHGNLHGAVEFAMEAKKIGVKPIIGCELYVTPGSRFEKKAKTQGGAGSHHLTVLASNPEGYQNLCRLVSLAYKEGFYFKPRVDHELLERYNAGLIVLSGCLGGELAAHVEREDRAGAKQLCDFYTRTFGDRFYLEVQPHAIREQRALNDACADLARDLGVPLVATNDCHYPTADDHHAQEVLMCVSTGKQITDPDRMKHDGVKLHLKSGDEMLAEFEGAKWAEEAIKNSVDIAARCSVDFKSNTYYMPRFQTSEGMSEADQMEQQARAGLDRRLGTLRQRRPDLSVEEEKVYRDRLDLEIALIKKMGFPGYLLVVSDFIVWAKEHGIPVGPGRGSAAGSLVAYAMRITDVDPIEHKLLFERFLNPERVSMPDIDVDFCINGRDAVIAYVVEKYGKENVAQIATFGTLKAKAAIKDVGRALGLSYAETDRIAQLIPAPRQGFDYSIEQSLEMEPRLAEYAAGEGKELIELAKKLEGLTRHTSTHAAGVVIGDRPLMDLLPMMVDKDGNDVTQYSMTYVEKVGLVKFDFLGLKTLTMIYTALEIIKGSRGETIDLELLGLDDRLAYEILCRGNTTGIFQLESSGITEMVIRLKPNSFDDLVAILALYRPGPLDSGMAEHYIERKHGREPVTYLHPLMEKTLKDTYGIILYQEQIMELARELAGYGLGEADLLRRAMGKKNPEEMAKQRDRFVSGATQRGVAETLASEIFDQMETFARYGFNRSHSAAYALISYQTAYLKAHYPVEFMAALMSHELDDSDKTLKNLNECRKQKVPVLPPDVNESESNFSVRDGKVRYGLGAVKGIGDKAVECIIKERAKDGPFTDFENVCERIDLRQVNRRVLENLVKCGAFDSLGSTRRELLERLDDVLKFAQALQRDTDTSQIGLFGAPSEKPRIPRKTLGLAEWPVNQRLSYEREALGFYISGHPVEKFKGDLKRLGALTIQDVKAGGGTKPSTSARGKGQARPNERIVKVGGVVTALKLKNTKKGDRYASFALEDWTGSVETIVWPDTYKENVEILNSDQPVLVSGRAEVSEERCLLVVDQLEPLLALRDKNATRGVLALDGVEKLDSRLEPLLRVLSRHSGPCPVHVRLKVDGVSVGMQLKDSAQSPVRVAPSETLCEEVEQVLGRPALSFS